MRIFNGIDEVETAVGEHLGYSAWFPVTQDRIDKFADATEDHQWIHVDPERAAQGPYGGTIAHGALVQVLPGWQPRHEIIHAVYASRRGQLPAVRALLDHLAQSFRTLSED